MIAKIRTHHQHVTATRIITGNLHILHLIHSWCVSGRTSVYHSRSKCLPSPLPKERGILLKLMCRRDSSKSLNLSSLSYALTFTSLWNVGKWLSLGQHVLSLYANAMLRWLYEGPSTRPITLGALAHVWWRFSIFYTFKWLRRPRLRCPSLPFDLLSHLTRWISM